MLDSGKASYSHLLKYGRVTTVCTTLFLECWGNFILFLAECVNLSLFLLKIKFSLIDFLRTGIVHISELPPRSI